MTKALKTILLGATLTVAATAAMAQGAATLTLQLTMNDNTLKEYAASEVKKLGVDKATGTVSVRLTDGTTDEYVCQVKRITFAGTKGKEVASQLSSYTYLKKYVNRDAYPNFRLGCATDLNSVSQTVHKLNFEEIVAGNEFKYASCVKDDGTMDFTSVKNFISRATTAGMQVYGHTLAWHSQQRPNYLKRLVDGKSKEQQLAVLTDAMERWIKGMMEACNGRVKAWDVVNEAIAGSDGDKDGFYDLQHDNGDANNFFWQDYMGDLEYVRTAVRLARQYGPEGVKLFVNDYNLESDWDDNKKLKSLIDWIKKWEADGVTVIDGIGTQMHISCSTNASTLNSRKKAVTNMFKLMAQTGKLIRVSELDMGITDNNGKSIKTVDVTEAQQQLMADFYRYIVDQYLTIIPPSQQWGICQWCVGDSPESNWGWRPGEPVGLWNEKKTIRKPAYKGFADGLAGYQ